MKQGMKKFFVFALLFAFVGLFSIPKASAQRGPHHKAQKKAYKKGFRQGYKQARHDDRCYRTHKRYRHHKRYQRYQRQQVVYQPRAVNVNIPLPPAPPLPPLPPFLHR